MNAIVAVDVQSALFGYRGDHCRFRRAAMRVHIIGGEMYDRLPRAMARSRRLRIGRG